MLINKTPRIEQNKNNFRKTEVQIVQKLQNEPRPKCTGSYEKKLFIFITFCIMVFPVS